MKKNKIKTKIVKGSLLVICILMILPSISAIQIHPIEEEDMLCNTNMQPDIEIVDISLKGKYITATIHSINAGGKTLVVDFTKSRIIGGIPTVPIPIICPIGDRMFGISPGETVEIQITWTGFGHYIIQVEMEEYGASAEVEVWWFLFFGWEINNCRSQIEGK